MRQFITRLLQGFEYQSPGEWFSSLAPSYKYNMVPLGIGVSAVSTVVDSLFGLDYLAFIGLLVVFVAELTSGLWASRIKNEAISSARMSRFTFKCAIYLLLISVPYLFAQSFHNRESDLAAGAFEWLHIFFIIQIVYENIISILENMAVIQGRAKTHWINKIQNKVDQIFS